MFSRSTTLVVLTRDRLIRADFDGAKSTTPRALAVRERPHIDDMATLVEMALASERRKPGRVFVLSADVWTHTLSLAAATVHGMSSAELLQALAFEAEPLSGMSAFDAATAAVPLAETAGQRTYWMTSIVGSVREQIQDAVRKAGGSFGGVLHPGGVPHLPEENPPAVLTGRVEFWPGATVRVVAREGLVSRCRVDDSGAASAWIASVDGWRAESGAAQVTAFVSEGEVPVDAAPDEYLSLSDEALLRRWLGGWNIALAEKAPAVPVVEPLVRPLTKQQRMAVAAVLGVVALGACWGHAKWIASENGRIAAERARVEAPGQELAGISQQIKKLETDQKKAQEEHAKLQDEVRHAEEVFDAHRRRLAELMRRLSEDSTHDWVLQKIDGTGAELKLTGTTMHPEHISLLAEGMSTDLARHGWTVDPPMQQARNLSDDGGPWTFELRLRDLNSLKQLPATDAAQRRDTVVGASRP